MQQNEMSKMPLLVLVKQSLAHSQISRISKGENLKLRYLYKICEVVLVEIS